MICPLCGNQANIVAEADHVQHTSNAVKIAMDKMTPIERNEFFADVKHQWLIRLPKIEDGASRF